MKHLLRLAALCAALCLALAGCAPAAAPGSSAPLPGSSADVQPAPAASAKPAGEEYRAVWISYLEWQSADFSSEDAFRAQMGSWFDQYAAMGLNTVLAQVRPFGDALYSSAIFPWSSVCTGTQGLDPGFDPLAVLVEEAHARGLRLEAWLNPYRLALNDTVPGVFSAGNLAAVHPEWVKQAAGGQYLDPSRQDVRDCIAAGVQEILDGYAVDGIHLDDYFYPTTDEAFDAAEYAAAGTNLSLEDWRRENVNALVRQLYQLVHAGGRTAGAVPLGISPQGNNDNNYAQQYSDAALWLSTPGYIRRMAGPAPGRGGGPVLWPWGLPHRGRRRRQLRPRPGPVADRPQPGGYGHHPARGRGRRLWPVPQRFPSAQFGLAPAGPGRVRRPDRGSAHSRLRPVCIVSRPNFVYNIGTVSIAAACSHHGAFRCSQGAFPNRKTPRKEKLP